jgi:hypothetical protein
VIAQIRKALVAAVATTLSAYVAAWAQTNGVLPGWPTVGACALMGVVAGLTTWGVPNARAVPEAVARLRAEADARRAAQHRASS